MGLRLMPKEVRVGPADSDQGMASKWPGTLEKAWGRVGGGQGTAWGEEEWAQAGSGPQWSC